MTMYTKLFECCSFIKDGTHSSPARVRNGIPVLSATNVVGGHVNFATDRFTSIDELNLFRQRLYPQKGDVLLTIVGTIGRTAILTETRPLVFQRSVCVLRPKKNILDPVYLRYVLESAHVKEQLERETHEVAQAGVYLESLNQIEILLPSLSEQKRIAAILEKADRLRRQRRYALELSGTYLQSVFLEMFGDPVTNPMGWEIIPLGEMLSISPHLGTITPARDSGKQLCVRVGEVGKWNINLNQCKYVSLEENELKRFSLQSGDIVLARAIGSEAHLGKLSIMGKSSKPIVFDSHLMRIRTDSSQLLPLFLANWLKTDGGRARFMQKARQTSVQFNINTEQIASIEMPVPPIPLQQKFVMIIEKHLRLQTQQREAERQAEHLFQTLLHKAFQGDLTPEEADISMPTREANYQSTGELRRVAEVIGKDAYQLALPME